MSGSIENELADALGDLGPEALAWAAALAGHWRLMCDWGERINLTSIADAREAAFLHYRDSLEPLKVLGEGTVLDVGSGAGFPGVPLAVALANREVTLLEPRRKRVSFLRTVKGKLGLTNLRVKEGRSTDSPNGAYDNIVTRATFRKPEDLEACFAWLVPGGSLIALRSAEDPVLAPKSHPYRVLGRERRLEIWTPG